MEQLKPALTIDEQIVRLQKRGLIIEDVNSAANFLRLTNYYRFSGYSFLFQKPNDQFYKGTTFEQIARLLSFDEDLRKIIITPLEHIEVMARSVIAHWFSLAHDRNGGAHYDVSLFDNPEFHAEYMESLNRQIERNSNQPFVLHHIQAFGGKMPLWCAVELLSFSTLSKLYSNMLQPDKDLIAANLDTDAAHLTNWLHCFSILRNACAHYSRLYKNACTPKISLDGPFLRAHPDVYQDTLFAYFVALLRIIPDEKSKDILTGQLALFSKKYDDISLDAIGFPENWSEIVLNPKWITLRPVAPEKKIIPHLSSLT